MEQRGCGSRFIAVMSPGYSVQAFRELDNSVNSCGFKKIYIDSISVVFMEEAHLKIGI